MALKPSKSDFDKAPIPVALHPSTKPYIKRLVEEETLQREEHKQYLDELDKKHSDVAKRSVELYAPLLRAEDIKDNGYLYEYHHIAYVLDVWDSLNNPDYNKVKKRPGYIPFSSEIVLSGTDPNSAILQILYRHTTPTLGAEGIPILHSAKDPQKPGGVIASGTYGNVRIAQQIHLSKQPNGQWHVVREAIAPFKARKVSKSPKKDLKTEHDLYVKSNTFQQNDMMLYYKYYTSILTTPLLPGSDLIDFLIVEENKTIGSSTLNAYGKLTVILCVFQKLEELATLGIVHRDIKPENIRVWAENETSVSVWVLDYGLSVNSGEFHEPAGTPEYIPLEMWGKRLLRVDNIQDIYALICTLHLCFSLTNEFTAMDKGLSVAAPYQKLYNFCKNLMNYQRLRIKSSLFARPEMFVAHLKGNLFKIRDEIESLPDLNANRNNDTHKENVPEVAPSKQEPIQDKADANSIPSLPLQISALNIT